MDFRWGSHGGILLDGNGDIALADPIESLRDMIRTRLKAALNGWKLYPIGADLERRLGETVSAELELSLKRQVQSSLAKDFLPTGSVDVRVLSAGANIDIFVYLGEELLSSVQLTRQGGIVQVS